MNLHHYTAAGLKVAALLDTRAGDTAPWLIALHGFPDTPQGFEPLVEQAARRGYRILAPFLRGYAPTGLAPDGDYRLPALAGDVLAWMDHFQMPQAGLIGHDWGAAIAYTAAVQAPQRIRRLVTAAVPHVGHFLFRPRLAQLRRSHYMFRFQWPGWAERTLPAQDYAWLRRLIRDWSPGWRPSEADLAPLLASFSQPDHLRAALAYYRALPGQILSRRARARVLAPVPVPTLQIIGEQDGCIGPEIFEGQAAYFPAGLSQQRLAAGHFMHWEQPAAFARAALDFHDGGRG